MKTPIQELIEWINLSKEDSKANGDALTVHLDDLREFADVLLEKEKELIMDAHSAGYNDTLNYLSGPTQNPFPTAKDYYNETFNTNEK